MLYSIKQILKKNKYIYSLNAFVKEKISRYQINKMNAIYSAAIKRKKLIYSQEETISALKDNLLKRGIDLNKFSDKNLKIFWVGASEAQDYSGFIQALSQYGTLEFFKKADGSYGQHFPLYKTFDDDIRKTNDDLLLSQVEAYIEEHGSLDILLGQMWANYISPEVLKKIKEMGVVVINIAMDDRLPVHWQRNKSGLMGSVGLAYAVDLTLNTCSEYCIRYKMHRGLCMFWPLASDPKVFKPVHVKDIDVCFVGNNYGIRGKIIDALLANGVKVEAYGGGFPKGYVNAEKIALLFGRSKIILGMGTVAHHKDIYTLKLRDFDATMAGAMYITHRNPDLLRLFKEDEDIVCYATIDELVKKVIYYLKNKEKREEIMYNALRKAKKYHTWEKRIGDVFNLLG